MRTIKIALVSMLSVTIMASGGEAFGSSGNVITHLAWKPKTEVLEYHSCGAADACWQAQVKNKKTKKRIATLRCDGEKLFSSFGKYPETITAPDCNHFENKDKFQLIPEKLRSLLHR